MDFTLTRQKPSVTPHHLLHQWPYLQQLLARKCLSYVDYALASALLKQSPQADESIAAFICHLSMAARKGNLCISIEGQTISPNPALIWLEGSDECVPEATLLLPEEGQRLTHLILQGAHQLPPSLVTDVTTHGTQDPYPVQPICRQGSLYYFQRYWLYETLFIEHLRKLEEIPPTLKLDETSVKNQVQLLRNQNRLLPEQAEAVLMGCRQGLSVICGGPGTGKTYTAGELIKVFWNGLSAEQRAHCEIALAAPTGKAAANLQNSLSRVVSELEGFPALQSKTLHSLLGIHGNYSLRDLSQKALTADLILVDESSMIDVYLITHLFASLKPGARLILLGDRHQLPPVEAGSLFSDLVAYLFRIQNERSQVTELKHCLRAELRTIVEFAAMINAGDTVNACQLLSTSAQTEGVSRLNLENSADPKPMQTALMAHAGAFFLTSNTLDQPLELLNHFNRFRILSPFRKGPFGVDRLNRLFLRYLIQKRAPSDFKHGQKSGLVLPIILTQNDRRLELFNGEVGVLVRFSQPNEQGEEGFQAGDYALFPSKDKEVDGNPVRMIPALLLPKYEYAFCLSVHKSQGSEFEHVLLMMPEGSEQFGREVLYTAVTRAKRKLEIWVGDQTLEKTIAQPSHRLSGLSTRLHLLPDY